MNISVLGSGGREAALKWKLKKDGHNIVTDSFSADYIIATSENYFNMEINENSIVINFKQDEVQF